MIIICGGKFYISQLINEIINIVKAVFSRQIPFASKNWDKDLKIQAYKFKIFTYY